MDLQTPLQYVKGIGPARAEMLSAKGLLTVEDLLFYCPFRYEDRTNSRTIAQLAPGEKAAVSAWVVSAKLSTFRRHSPGLLEVNFEDASGPVLLGRWFHGERFRDSLVPGARVALFGKVELDHGLAYRLMVQPEVEMLSSDDAQEETLHSGRIVAIYEAASKVSARVFRSLIDRVLKTVELPADSLPTSVRRRLELPDLPTAIREVHSPSSETNLQLLNEFRTPAQVRLIFDEFFWLECGLALKKHKSRQTMGIAFDLSARVREQIKSMLPFKPTAAQRRVVQDIANDMKANRPMNRLLQGDVGSGKTIVAAQAAVIAIESGYQVAVLAPTEILAVQHFSYFRNILQKLGYEVLSLTGSLTAREKQKVKQLIAEGFVKVVIGTHALLEEDVSFAKLGLAIVDEQHRFGVRQRLQLFKKGAPDVLVMTATPIPRTLALTLYGDLDVSSIDELPPGRRPVQTRQVARSAIEGIYGFVAQQVEAGRQAYFVYPLVEETETNADTKAAEKMYLHLTKSVFPTLSVGLLHGKLSAYEKDTIMQRFQAGEIDILVATTVIEVGVDVPNASVMVIEDAERFGLAQLHQLRGRVGRGPHQSYCILVTGKLNDVARERIKTLVDSNDGFFIAEMDMKLRGPGEFFGTKQSGVPGLRLADLLRDGEILELARAEAKHLIETGGSSDEVRAVNRYIQEHWQRRYGLVLVG